MFNPLCISYPKSVIDQMKVSKESACKKLALFANNILNTNESYEKSVKSVLEIEGLKPSANDRHTYWRYHNKLMAASMKTARKKSFFSTMFAGNKSVLLYGKKSIHYIHHGEENTRQQTLLREISHSFEFASMQNLDPHGLERIIRQFKGEGLSMKLVIRQYLASLQERGQLDAILPDLLSQMGLEVFLKHSVVSRQYGIDVGSYGKLDGDVANNVYLFSLKVGDLDRKDWDSGNPEDLRPSINEIVDIFIPTRIPPEYKDAAVEICLCFGGDVKEEVRSNVSLFLERQKSDDLSFSEWNGDRLAALVEKFLLREELLPKNCRGLLRKSLAMIDKPETSLKHFK